MSKSFRHIPKVMAVCCLVGCLGLNSVLAATVDQVKLRGSIDQSQPAIPLKSGVKIDRGTQTITLNLRDSDVRQVLRMLADKAGMNLVLHDSVKGQVNVDLVNVTLNKAFEYVMSMNGLAMWQDKNTLVISGKGVADTLGVTKTQMKPLRVKYLEAASAAAFLNANIFSVNNPAGSSSPIVVTNPKTNEVYIFGNENDVAMAQKVLSYIDVQPKVKVFTVNYANARDVANKVCATVFDSYRTGGGNTNGSSANSTNTSSNNNGSNGGSNSNGSNGSSGTTGSSSGNMIDFDDSTNILSCGSASSTTAQNSGGSIGGQIGNTGITNNNSMNNMTTNLSSTTTGSNGQTNEVFNGINASLLSLDASSYMVITDPRSNQITLFGATDEQMDMAADIIKKFDKKQPQVYIEVSIIELTESGSKSLAHNIMAQTGSASFGFKNGQSTGELISNHFTSYPGMAGTGKFLNNFDAYGGSRFYSSSIKALVEQRKGRVLANPRIVATNNKTSVVNISSDYVKTRKVENVTNVNAQTQTITYEIDDAGIKLSITPRISSNGYVTLNVVPSYTAQKEQIKDANSNIVATLLNKRDLDLSSIRVKDGDTFIIGGLLQETDSNTKQKVPVLGDLPIFGNMFRASSTDKSKSELILMITPKIIQEDDTVESM